MTALRQLSARTWSGPSRGLVIVAALLCGLPHESAPAATGPVDDGAIEPPSSPSSASINADIPTSDNPAVRETSGNPLWAVPLSSLSNTRERPLFSPLRRPPAAAAVVAPVVPVRPPPKSAEPDHPLLTLVGTIVGGSQDLGIFVDEATKNVVRLKMGDVHAGWTLRAVERREATFKKDQREVTLALPARGAPSQAASIAAPLSAWAIQNGSWRDGDGQLISPPAAPQADARATPQTPQQATWRDGDGQLISPPAARAGN